VWVPDQDIGAADEDAIARIACAEAEIERLAAITEGCGKIILVAKAAIAIGGLMLLATILGVIRLDQLVAIGSIHRGPRRHVALSSNTTTLPHVTTNLRATHGADRGAAVWRGDRGEDGIICLMTDRGLPIDLNGASHGSIEVFARARGPCCLVWRGLCRATWS
jgi:hypothetical protein